MNVVVVGLGAMGAAALAHLARRGLRPVGLDQFAPGHDRGSSHGWSRVIRQAYFEHPDYVPLLRRAFTLWDELQAETGADIVHRRGVLILGGPDSQAIRLSQSSAELHGIETEFLAPDALRSRYPQFHVPEDYGALLEPGAGFAIPEHGNAAHLEIARRHVADIRAGVSVQAIKPDGDAVRVSTSDGELLADHVVVAAGAWTRQLVPSLSAALSPQRKVLAWFEDAAAPVDDPVWLIDDGASDGVYYGVPSWSDQVGPAGMKLGFHGPGPAVQPGEREPADPEILARFERDMGRWRPDLGAIESSTTCLYTMTPDEHFLVGPVPNVPRVSVACGFSGHGYKFAPVIGEVLADFAIGRTPSLALDFLSPARFGTHEDGP